LSKLFQLIECFIDKKEEYNFDDLKLKNDIMQIFKLRYPIVMQFYLFDQSNNFDIVSQRDYLDLVFPRKLKR